MIHICTDNRKEHVIPLETWYRIKSTIIECTFGYLNDLFEQMKQQYGHIADVNHSNYIGPASSYYNDMKDLRQIEEELSKHAADNHYNKIYRFRQMCAIMNIENAFYRFGISGLYILCFKSDYDAYYSPGNSSDICDLIANIESYMENDDLTYKWIYDHEGILSTFAIAAVLKNQIIIK